MSILKKLLGGGLLGSASPQQLLGGGLMGMGGNPQQLLGGLLGGGGQTPPFQGQQGGDSLQAAFGANPQFAELLARLQAGAGPGMQAPQFAAPPMQMAMAPPAMGAGGAGGSGRQFRPGVRLV